MLRLPGSEHEDKHVEANDSAGDVFPVEWNRFEVNIYPQPGEKHNTNNAEDMFTRENDSKETDEDILVRESRIHGTSSDFVHIIFLLLMSQW